MSLASGGPDMSQKNSNNNPDFLRVISWSPELQTTSPK